jgi:quercetin dioxygenase-like cupin family protein
MNILKELILKPEKPARMELWHEGSVKQMVIGLKRQQILPAHKTPYPARLVVLQGSIEFQLGEEKHVLDAFDTFLIPVNELHAVVGREEANVFLVTKHITTAS